MRPVGDISWRVAAMYCNWLHNDKRNDRAAFLNGAYDVSTFGYLYDLNKVNLDGSTGGWWKYSITQPANGPPGGQCQCDRLCGFKSWRTTSASKRRVELV